MRRLVPLAAAALLLMVGPGEAAAITDIVQGGNVGYWHARDGNRHPGIICVYQETSLNHGPLLTVRVQPPNVVNGYYEETSKVAWGFRLMRSDSKDGPYNYVFESRKQADMANDIDAATKFTRRNYSPAHPEGWPGSP